MIKCQAHLGVPNISSHLISYLISLKTLVPPFNVADVIKCPYFTVDETRELFCEFAQDLSYLIDDAIVEDVWAKSNGSVAQLD